VAARERAVRRARHHDHEQERDERAERDRDEHRDDGHRDEDSNPPPPVVRTAVMADELLSIGKRRPAPARAAAPGDGPRVYIETYGCQMNVADSDLLGGILAGAGYARAERADDADVVVVNTCAVREKAEERVTARVAELAALKRKRPGLTLA